MIVIYPLGLELTYLGSLGLVLGVASTAAPFKMNHLRLVSLPIVYDYKIPRLHIGGLIIDVELVCLLVFV